MKFYVQMHYSKKPLLSKKNIEDSKMFLPAYGKIVWTMKHDLHGDAPEQYVRKQ